MEEQKNNGKVEHDYTNYIEAIRKRSFWHFFKGFLIRWYQHFKYEKAVRIARKRGASVGEGVIMPLSLARRANSNLIIGNHVSIQTDKIDMRSPVKIGNYVIIGSETEIITTSHDIDSPLWNVKKYGITIDDYVWLPTHVMILPSCRYIGMGAVVGSGSVVVKNIDAMSVVSGNPAKFLKKRECVHYKLVVESLLGGDYYVYRKAKH